MRFKLVHDETVRSRNQRPEGDHQTPAKPTNLRSQKRSVRYLSRGNGEGKVTARRTGASKNTESNREEKRPFHLPHKELFGEKGQSWGGDRRHSLSGKDR